MAKLGHGIVRQGMAEGVAYLPNLFPIFYTYLKRVKKFTADFLDWPGSVFFLKNQNKAHFFHCIFDN